MFEPHLLLPVDQQDVMSVEKTYWSLRGLDKCSLKTFEQYTSPPLPKELCASESERMGGGKEGKGEGELGDKVGGGEL